MNVPQFDHAMDGLFPYFQFGTIMNKAAMNILAYVFPRLCLLISVGNEASSFKFYKIHRQLWGLRSRRLSFSLLELQSMNFYNTVALVNGLALNITQAFSESGSVSVPILYYHILLVL